MFDSVHFLWNSCISFTITILSESISCTCNNLLQQNVWWHFVLLKIFIELDFHNVTMLMYKYNTDVWVMQVSLCKEANSLSTSSHSIKHKGCCSNCYIWGLWMFTKEMSDGRYESWWWLMAVNWTALLQLYYWFFKNVTRKSC